MSEEANSSNVYTLFAGYSREGEGLDPAGKEGCKCGSQNIADWQHSGSKPCAAEF